MDCQFAMRRRPANWDEIEEAPQIKKFCEDVKTNQFHKEHVTTSLQVQQQQEIASPQIQQVPPSAPPQSQQSECVSRPEVSPETPKFYISAPIQGYTTNDQGGCRYLFF